MPQGIERQVKRAVAQELEDQTTEEERCRQEAIHSSCICERERGNQPFAYRTILSAVSHAVF